MFWSVLLYFECSQVRYGNSVKGAETKSQVCDRWRVDESCHKFLDKLLTYSVTRERGTVGLCLEGWGDRYFGPILGVF